MLIYQNSHDGGPWDKFTTDIVERLNDRNNLTFSQFAELLPKLREHVDDLREHHAQLGNFLGQMDFPLPAPNQGPFTSQLGWISAQSLTAPCPYYGVKNTCAPVVACACTTNLPAARLLNLLILRRVGA